ncbi:adenine glycosylase [Williamsia sp. Leaf354]|uniref:A/G-specific adenine glycosylase n=1 Tax=Williamsia sp. Leaf354 TaxID=1736349 RepID=UPI0006F41BDC|nr:A/G-specific adenine glycosylase [Williamsia sp. Leaf354]KQR96354.1 adenine glycosylase [Williamsia sp. Leaf354]
MADIVPNSDVTRRLLSWFDDHERDLPWRAEGVTPWQILMSEIMLQQTPVARVAPIWLEWVARWPVPSAMAAAGVGEVVRAWGKLGYPRRAMRLHACATVLAQEHGDVVPSDVGTLLTLPGIGDYTARAIACFAYGQSVPVVDINVRRVIARALHGRDAGNPTRSDMDDAAALLPRDRTVAPRFSAALMELGALVCTARNPRCGDCPLPHCLWNEIGRPALDTPRKVQKFAGTDRQVRGLILDQLRAADGPVGRDRIDAVWLTDIGQRERALDSLLADGLMETTSDGRFCLAGEGG